MTSQKLRIYFKVKGWLYSNQKLLKCSIVKLNHKFNQKYRGSFKVSNSLFCNRKLKKHSNKIH